MGKWKMLKSSVEIRMKLKKERLVLIIILTIVSLFFLLEKGFLPGITSNLTPRKGFELLGRVIGIVKRDYIEEVDPEKTMRGALKGMVNSLDVLTSYLDSENVAKYLQLKRSVLLDTGMILYKKYNSFPVLIGIVDNSPAQKRGLKIGDTISALDGKSTLAMSLIEARLRLKDIEKKPVAVKVLKRGKAEVKKIEREPLFKKPYSFLPGENIKGILRINQLYPPCVDLIKKEVLPLLKSSRRELVLDLRDCHEGEMDEALKLVNLFLKADSVGYFEKNNGKREILASVQKAPLEKTSLVIWINQATMGPAEAVAGILQEVKKAKVIGVPTLGLVAKQELFLLEDGSGILLTTGIFHLKSGKKLWETGLEPEIEIKGLNQSSDVYLKKTLAILPLK